MQRGVSKMLVLVLGLACAMGCQLSPNDGVVIFEDETPRAEGRFFDLDRPVAVGSEIRLSIEARRFVKTSYVRSVSVENSDLLEVVEVHENGVHLRALSAGETTLTAVLSDGAVGELTIETRAIATTELKFYPWDPRIALDPRLWAEGIALIEGASTRIYLEHRAEDGRVLTGFGGRSPQVSEVELVELVSADQSDFYTLVNHAGTGHFTLMVDDNETHHVEVVGFESIARLGLVNPMHRVEAQRHPAYEGETLKFDGAGSLLHIDARTTDDRYVMGNPGLALAVTVDGDSNLTVHLGDAERRDTSMSVERALNRGRAFLLQGPTEGPESIEVSWGDLVTTVQVESI